MKIENFFNQVPQKSEQELFEPVWKNAHFLLERIISTGQSTPVDEWYEQAHEEWVIVLQGSAILRFEHAEYRLNVGDYVLIPAGCRHRVEWTDTTQPTLWLALHARGDLSEPQFS